MKLNIKGSIVALVTPFKEDGSVSFDRLKELLEWHVAQKTDGILILGTTGESSTMTHEEDDAVVAFTLKTINRRIPVIVGSGSNCTKTMVDKSLEYEAMGADALLVISPYYNKTNTKGMIQHFTAVADKVSIPLILYNVPGRTACNISKEAIAILSKHEKICAIKEASGNISYVADIAQYINEEFQLFSGNDDMIVPILSLGGSGVISVLANIVPNETHRMVMDYLNGDRELALKTQLTYLNLIHALFCEVNPIPVKEALNMMGKPVGGFRLPLYEMDDKHRDILKEALKEVGLC